MVDKSGKRIARIKASLLLVFLVSTIALMHGSPIKDYITVETLSELLGQTGSLAPLTFLGVFVVGACLFVPGSLLASLGAVVFGSFWGFVYAWIGAMLGAAVSFHIGRYLGRDFAASITGDRLKRYDDFISRNGFVAVLYLRLIYFPYCPMNYGMGLTRVRFRDFFWGSALGLTVSLFFITYFAGSLWEAWQSGQWQNLASWKTLLAIATLALSLYIPRFIQKGRTL